VGPARERQLTNPIALWGSPPRGRRMGRRNEFPTRLIRRLIYSLLDSPDQTRSPFGEVLHQLFDYAQRGNLSACLSSRKAVRLLSEAWQDGGRTPAGAADCS